MEEQLLGFLESLHTDEKRLQKLLAIVEEEQKKDREVGNGSKEAIEKGLERCRRSLDNLTKLSCRDLISEEEFVQQRAELTQEQAKLAQRLEQLNAERWIEPTRNLFLFSNRAIFWLTHGSAAEKRLIVSTVGSNLLLQGKKISIDAKKSFSVLLKNRSFSDLWTVVNDVRTFFESESHETIPLLPDPRNKHPHGESTKSL